MQRHVRVSKRIWLTNRKWARRFATFQFRYARFVIHQVCVAVHEAPEHRLRAGYLELWFGGNRTSLNIDLEGDDWQILGDYATRFKHHLSEAVTLFLAAGLSVLEDNPDLNPEDITASIVRSQRAA